MNIETRHKLVDLRSEVNKERDQEILVAKQDYLETVSIQAAALKVTIKGIKATRGKITHDKRNKRTNQSRKI